MKKGDTVTQRGVWLPAAVTQVGDQVILSDMSQWDAHDRVRLE